MATQPQRSPARDGGQALSDPHDIVIDDAATLTVRHGFRDWLTGLVAFVVMISGAVSVYYSLSKRIDEANAVSAARMERLTVAIDRLTEMLPLQRQVFGQQLQEAILSKLPGPEVTELAKQVSRLSDSVQKLETRLTVIESRDRNRPE